MGKKRWGRQGAAQRAATSAPAPPPASAAPTAETAGALKPTPELLNRVEFPFGEVRTEMGIKIGAAYRRRPLFETLAKTTRAIAADDLEALRFYRSAFDRCERSPTKSCLDVTGGGGSNSAEARLLHSTPALVEARRKVRFCEEAMHPYLATMRAVALDDRSFSEIAIERFGSRHQSWLVDEEPVSWNGKIHMVDGKPQMRKVFRDRVVPRSGRHRDVIRTEFLAGLRKLTERVQSLFGAAGIEEIWVQLHTDGTAAIERGACAPNGLYRLWGSGAVLDAIIADVRRERGGLAFEAPADARAALDAAAEDRQVSRLDEQDLAA